MERNKHIADFGDLNEFFDEYVSPQEFMDDLTDIIEEYSRLALVQNQDVYPNETALRISLLGLLHRELRKIVR